MESKGYWQRQISRRRMLQAAALGGAGVAATAIFGCGEETKKGAPAASPGAPAASPAPSPKPAIAAPAAARDKLGVVALFDDVRTLDPATFYFTTEGVGIMQALYDSILRYTWNDDPNGIEGSLAEKWEQPDNRTYIFQLRPKVKFHDGTDFNAEALRFWVERVKALKGPPAFHLAVVEKLEILDPLKVKMTLEKPLEPFVHYLANFWTSSRIVSPAAIKAHDTAQDANSEKWLLSNTVGTGPYKLDKHIPGQEYQLSRFEQHWRGWEGSHMERYVARIIPDTAQRRLLMEGGDLHINPRAQPYTDVEALQKKGYSIKTILPSGANFIVFNNKQGPFVDKRVRQAIAYSIDYDFIEKDLLRGFGTRSYSPFPAVYEGSKKGHLPAQQDLKKAKELLEAAGLRNAEIEFFHDPSGKAFGQPVAEQVDSVLRGFNLGLKLKIVEAPGAVRVDRIKKVETTPDATWGGARGDGLSAYLWGFLWWHSKSGFLNWGRYSNPEYDKLLDQAVVEFDKAKRVALYERAAEIIGQDIPALTVFEEKEIILSNPNIAGIKTSSGYPWSFDWHSAFWKT